MAGIFKAYDIRGIYPTEVNEEIAYKIGFAYAKLIGKGPIAIGRDMRKSSLPLFQELSRGITDAGLDVIDIGLVTTPMTTYCNGKYQYHGSIMVTASHNSKEYNGFKLSRKNAIPLGYDTGLAEIEKFAANEICNPVQEKNKGEIYTKDITDDYIEHVLSLAEKIKPLKIVIDAGNGMGGHICPKIFEKLPCKLVPLYFELDGNFPNHDANPLEKENMIDLQKAVIAEKADLGAAFDGDADRIMFVDNHGELVSADITTALIAKNILLTHPNEIILYDLRSSKAVKEIIEKAGGTAHMTRVGHAFIKKQLREENSIFAGEFSGHYYFRDHYYTDCASMALMHMLSLLSKENTSLSNLIEPLKKYYGSGEINSRVKDPDISIKAIEEKYKDAKINRLDGILIEYPTWWFNVRKSNTEPLLRLIVEADTELLLKEKTKEILDMIRS
ncbi:MAG: phosphomannomutase/phosphoglucomutase [Chlamydiota bacterium]|nr:phosphomannomutase/phosphoglucomutase [Chlamydiota bacterium]